MNDNGFTDNVVMFARTARHLNTRQRGPAGSGTARILDAPDRYEVDYAAPERRQDEKHQRQMAELTGGRNLTMREVMRLSEQVDAIEGDKPTWPQVPYSYSQGRIPAYEVWLASLSETARARELRAVRARSLEDRDRRQGLMIQVLREREFTP